MDSCELGRRGEDLAVGHLRGEGWRILDRNFRLGRHEVDIVASKGNVLAFVEVKSRRGQGFGHPFEAIDWKKRLDIARVARGWLRERTLPDGVLVRFDAVGVIWRKGGRTEVLHVPDAWRLD